MLNQQVILDMQVLKGVSVGVDKVVLGIVLTKDGLKDNATMWHIQNEINGGVGIFNLQKKIFTSKGSSGMVGKYKNEAGDKGILLIRQ